MEQWIKSDLKQFQKMYQKYNRHDSALGNCAMMMVKILNGLSEMTITQFHRYEKKMLWKAMELFSRQCIEQINIAAQCQDDLDKKEYIEDLEISISEIAEVYRNTMGDVSNVERQMFQSLAVDAKMYDLSPKLCAFYSSILEKVVAMFAEEGKDYAFVLHPMLRNTIEAKVLLKTRRQSGMVVIIYIPEGVIEQFDLVCVCLIHETFHVLTQKERNRQKRMVCFMKQMILQIQRLIFEGVNFGTEDVEIKDNLKKQWFVGMKQKISEYQNGNADDNTFYGEQARIEIEKKMKECLAGININLENEVKEMAFKVNKYKDFYDFQQQTDRVLKNINILRGNIFEIACKNKITVLCDTLMFLYRETYADIACIMLLEINLFTYDKAFEDSIRFQRNDSFVDEIRILRERLVSDAVSKKINTWNEGQEVIVNPVSENSVNGNSKIEGRQNKEGYDNICVDTHFRKIFAEYLDACAEDLSIRLQSIRGIESFRKYMVGIITGKPQNSLEKVLKGDVAQ